MVRTSTGKEVENTGLVASHAGLTLARTDAFSCPCLELSTRVVRERQHRCRPGRVTS